MGYISNINPYSEGRGGTAPKYDHTQAVGDFINDFWVFFNKIETSGPTDDAQMKAFLQNVNNFVSFINKNGAPDSNDPNTLEIWRTITQLSIGPTQGPTSNWTLQQYANDFASNPGALNYRDLEIGNGLRFLKDEMATILQWYQGYTPPLQQANTSDKAIAQFLQDMESFYEDLKAFKSNPSSNRANLVISDITTLLSTDAANLPGGQITDGYLVSLKDFIKANKLDAYTDPNQMMSVLNSAGGIGPSANTTICDDLLQFIYQSGKEEFGNKWSPS